MTRVISIVSTAVRQDLVPVTARWRWQAFFKEETSLDEMLRLEEECASNDDLMPTVLVMLDDEKPVGMIALCLDDLEGRPELNPWLAGVYVDHAHRGKGYALRLIEALEALARREGISRLSLYTSSSVGLYRKAGWAQIETFVRDGNEYSIMQKNLSLN
ncbi:GNAT family N-acetyltransferase [Sinorhizobium meliloti]|nr:GNAT family N-acetyltransferase [Sinorhizobium meliloti]MDW9374113.1 GNAT family N-acetyltransferase [Sinorhizobium meliloti]MDW9463905.1 GNAT family N-acetyltransferase [Sinorhizobium meliloti]MDW9492558.1 GNAT family N-acetyltransferase [Sinorhizobium meliloti]MDW9561041.1 GNAT family N-acetyltransferase [Sinorhizobium meliloti]MDW9596614.1 GNAT family N-acetyltransferase [Sinorhizobium meliloti]